MQSRHTSGPALVGLGLLILCPAAHAQTQFSGTNTGTPGTATSGAGTLDNTPGDYNFGKYILNGYSGNAGRGFDTGAFSVHDATFTGGAGGETTGAVDPNTASPNNLPDIVNAGTGGEGLNVGQGASSMSSNTVATIQNGTYTGGVGGTADGTANATLDGGYGGDGAIIFGATATVNGGTFRGADSGSDSGTAPSFQSGFGGSGLNVNYYSNVVINGGTFIGANGADVTQRPGSSNDAGGAAGSGLLAITDQNGTVNVYGGTFIAGHSGNVFAPDGKTVVSAATPGNDISVYGGTTTLFGKGFIYTVTDNNGTTTGTGPITITAGVNGQPFGTITGFLQDNSQTVATTITFAVYGGSLVLAAAPEPSQAAALGIGLLGLGVLAFKARRRIAA